MHRVAVHQFIVRAPLFSCALVQHILLHIHLGAQSYCYPHWRSLSHRATSWAGLTASCHRPYVVRILKGRTANFKGRPSLLFLLSTPAPSPSCTNGCDGSLSYVRRFVFHQISSVVCGSPVYLSLPKHLTHVSFAPIGDTAAAFMFHLHHAHCSHITCNLLEGVHT